MRLYPIANSIRQSLMVPGLLKGEAREKARAKLADLNKQIEAKCEAARERQAMRSN